MLGAPSGGVGWPIRFQSGCESANVLFNVPEKEAGGSGDGCDRCRSWLWSSSAARADGTSHPDRRDQRSKEAYAEASRLSTSGAVRMSPGSSRPLSYS